MKTQLDEKQELIKKIEFISNSDEIQKLKIFISGMEAGKTIMDKEPERAAGQGGGVKREEI